MATLKSQGYEYRYLHDSKNYLHWNWNYDSVVHSWKFSLQNYLSPRDTLRDKDPFAFPRVNKSFSSICDTSGMLLFYTDGDTIYNDRGYPISFGWLMNSSFNGINSSIFVRLPGQFRYYYLIQSHASGSNKFSGISYTLIDRYHASGNPSLIFKNKPILKAECFSYKCSYGKTIDTVFLYVALHGKDSIHKFQITSAGLILKESFKAKTDTCIVNQGGTLRKLSTSQNGNSLAIINYRWGGNIFHVPSSQFLFNSDTLRAFRGEFSPNGRFFYAMLQNNRLWRLVQYDLQSKTANNRLDSTVIYESTAVSTIASVMFIGPDQKIYCNGPYEISVIQYPNQKGRKCLFSYEFYKFKFSPIGLKLGYNYGNHLPHFAINNPKIVSCLPFCSLKKGTILTETGFNDSSYLFIGNEKYFSDSNHFEIKPLGYGKLPVRVDYKANDTWLTFTDTIFVKENKRVSILGSPVICGSAPALITASDSFTGFRWSHGDSTREISVVQPLKAFVVIPDSVCAHSDTVEVVKITEKNYILQEKAGLCPGDSVRFSITPTANHAFIRKGADSSQQITIHKPGNYILSIDDSGCIFIDSVNVFRYPKHRAVSSSYLLACKDSVLKVTSLVAGAIWNWQGKQTASDTLRFIPEGSGKLVLTSKLQCLQSDSIAVDVRYCQRPKITYYLPTAFTPDANGLNDVYLPQIHEMRLENMKVFNRWGQLLYDGSTGWNGMYANFPCANGVYVVKLTYGHLLALEEPPLSIAINLTLIR